MTATDRKITIRGVYLLSRSVVTIRSKKGPKTIHVVVDCGQDSHDGQLLLFGKRPWPIHAEKWPNLVRDRRCKGNHRRGNLMNMQHRRLCARPCSTRPPYSPNWYPVISNTRGCCVDSTRYRFYNREGCSEAARYNVSVTLRNGKHLLTLNGFLGWFSSCLARCLIHYAFGDLFVQNRCGCNNKSGVAQ